MRIYDSFTFLIYTIRNNSRCWCWYGRRSNIKPTLDLISDYNVVTISFLSSITVFSMAIVSTIKQIRSGFKINKVIVAVTVGAVFGGVLGSQIFAVVKDSFEPSLVTIIQFRLYLILLFSIFAYFYNKNTTMPYKRLFGGQALVGLTLGMLASFLGIGGGPINVAALCVFMGTELRLSARISVFIILFAQMAGLITKAATGMVSQVQDFTVLLAMIPAAIIGGLVGSQLNLKLSDKKSAIY